MIPLSVPNVSKNEWKYIKKCLDAGWVSSAGNFVNKFEEAVCKFVKSPYAVACMNGTSGLFIALRILDIGKGDEVIVPTLTFIAPVNAVKYVGAEPVFMDCDEYMNIDAEKVESFCRQECKIGRQGLKNKKSGRIVKAIIPVHIFGNPCNMEKIMAIAAEYKLKVIEDATESIGSCYKRGKFFGQFTGVIGDIGVYSFNGNKIITTGGGGMIVTKNRLLKERAFYITNQARDDGIRYIHNEIGYNLRLTNLQAALGIAQLEQLKNFIIIKKNNYELYKRLLADVNGLKFMETPEGSKSNYWFYSLIIDKEKYGLDRDELMLKLDKKNIQTRPVWYLNHWQKPYRINYAYKIEKAVWFWKRVLSLPCSTNLKASDVEIVSKAIKNK